VITLGRFDCGRPGAVGEMREGQPCASRSSARLAVRKVRQDGRTIVDAWDALRKTEDRKQRQDRVKESLLDVPKGWVGSRLW
jgi:hypothetical protein